jgi:isopentenyl phosphate kinase
MNRERPSKSLVFLKLGGSLLTDKVRAMSVRSDVVDRLSEEIAAAIADRPEMQILIGHGSGSFGHVTAHRYQTRRGVVTPEQWAGYAETARVASELNRLVVEALGKAGVPALPVQPSASAYCRDGELSAMVLRPIRIALKRGLAPVIYGDVALDAVRGGTIVSTEELFAYLTPRLRPRRILLAGEVPGVMTCDPALGGEAVLIEQITPARLPDIAGILGASRGIDVTGGMAAKVEEMVGLLEATASLDAIQVISGIEPGQVYRALVNPTAAVGTRIVRDAA